MPGTLGASQAHLSPLEVGSSGRVWGQMAQMGCPYQSDITIILVIPSASVSLRGLCARD